jgi:RNA polymerase sigma-70 factor (ECF subfamily)
LAELQTKSTATLGDVLYADQSKPRESEAVWARLVAGVGSGDQMALHALYERAHRPVFTLAMRLTASRETAEELTVDVFHEVWRRAPAYDAANGTVLGWIMNLARSRALDRVRFERRQKRVDPHGGEAPIPEHSDACAEALEARQRSAGLRAALAELAPAERQAIEAAYFSGLTYAETAARLEQPLGTVKTRIRSGLFKLRRALAGVKAS